jgi:hypothetical protein
MDQTLFEGISLISFYVAGAIGLLVAVEIAYNACELAASAINKRFSSLSSLCSRGRQKHSANCSCHALPSRLRG